MKAIDIKQLVIVIISSIGLFTTGNYLSTMAYIKSLTDGLNVMIFFTCFFPFLIVSFTLLAKFYKSVYRYTFH